MTVNVSAHIDNDLANKLEKVAEFEDKVAAFCGSRYAIATVNGTAALHVSLKLAGVDYGDEVICQALTFIATCNSIKSC